VILPLAPFEQAGTVENAIRIYDIVWVIRGDDEITFRAILQFLIHIYSSQRTDFLKERKKNSELPLFSEIRLFSFSQLEVSVTRI
jgi:hypothetical protein